MSILLGIGLRRGRYYLGLTRQYRQWSSTDTSNVSVDKIHLESAWMERSRKPRSSAPVPMPLYIDVSPPQPPAIKRNDLGVQLLSRKLHDQVFQHITFPSPPTSYTNIAREHISSHGLDPTQGSVLPDIGFDLPPLQGLNLLEHFHRIGVQSAQPWLSLAKDFAAASLPPKPDHWDIQSGWTKYHYLPNGLSYSEHVEWPIHDGHPECMLVFDVETMPKYHQHAIIACAASKNAWYAWISPWLLGETHDPEQLIPLGGKDTARIVIGHNVSYDRSRISEEYHLEPTRTRFIDTMALHVAVKGISSHQRPAWMKYRKSRQTEKTQKTEAAEVIVDLMHDVDMRRLREQDALKKEELKRLRQELEESLPQLYDIDGQDADAAESELSSKRWEELTSANSLADVAKLHCHIDMDKEVRDDFMTLTPEDIRGNLVEYLNYCSTDVDVTHKVFKQVLPAFLTSCPHPVSFAGMLTMGSSFLMVNGEWEGYLERAEVVYKEMAESVTIKLKELAEKARGLMDSQIGESAGWKDDAWLSQLDWTPKAATKTRGVYPPNVTSTLAEVGAKKRGSKSKVPKPPPVLWPKWYWDATRPRKGVPPGTLDITIRSRIAPLLLRLSWLGWPLFYSREHGWTFRVSSNANFMTRSTPLTFYDPADNALASMALHGGFVFYKLPHKDGEKANVGNPLGKTFLKYAQDGTLKSPGDEAKEALDMNAQCSYWMSARDRILNQMVIWQKEERQLGFSPRQDSSEKWGIIIPQVITMGTVTRRAIEKTWLTASNAKKNRVGSELKAMVRAPEGYAIVGADVDSEELWISSCMGDAQFGLHGATAIGWITLEGTKAAGTDLHSKTAQILGISRDQAKVFNYSRIYGAGMRHAILLLLQSNPGMLPDQAQKLAENLYASTKGKNTHRTDIFGRKFWFGGTESFVFNKLEEIALSDKPQTPALGCGVTHALSKEYLPAEFGTDYMPSRINWVVQSSGVDYLHLLIVSMNHLISKYSINARYLISVHDELRYLVKEEDKYRAALALQIANLWTRSLFACKLGMDDLPQSVAFFSAVDVDKVLRKEVDMPCVTPSQPNPIPLGESLDIIKVLERTNGGSLWKDGRPMAGHAYDRPADELLVEYEEADCLVHRSPSAAFLQAQATSEFEEVKCLARMESGKDYVGGIGGSKSNIRNPKSSSSARKTPQRKPRKVIPVGNGEGVDWTDAVEEHLRSEALS